MVPAQPPARGLQSSLADESGAVAALASRVEQLTFCLDTMWTLICGAIVMLMQAGFALFEAGSVRSKNSSTVLLKNLIDVCVGTVGWWLVGYGVAFGEGGAFSGGSAFPVGWPRTFGEDGSIIATERFRSWFFQWTFCATSATIVSGGVAERINFFGYIFYSLWMTVLIYPFVVHWCWTEEGWLAAMGFSDFAGSGVVHLTGGVAALCGAVCLGPRSGRFAPGNEDEFSPHSVPLVVLGTLVLWFGWYGFNPGSTLSFSDVQTATTATLVAMNTTLAPVASGLTVFAFRWWRSRRFDITGICGAILVGLVAICSGCDVMLPHSAFIIGIVAGLLSELGHHTLLRLKVDDPLDAFAVHGCGGLVGVVARAFVGPTGVDGALLGTHLLGALAICAWSALLSVVCFMSLHWVGMLRLSDEIQNVGTDAHELTPARGYAYEASPVVSPRNKDGGHEAKTSAWS